MDIATFNEATGLASTIKKIKSIIEIIDTNKDNGLSIIENNGYNSVYLDAWENYQLRVIEKIRNCCEDLLKEMEGQFKDL